MKTKFLRYTLSLLLIIAGGSPAFAASEANEILSNLTPNHPYLVLEPGKIEELRELIKTNEIAKGIYARVKTNTDAILEKKPLEYELRDGRRLIYVSGDVMDRVSNLALLHLITNDRKYAERAWLELESAAMFKDWNPDHFLDTAIMTKAFAIGLDWLWDEWTPEQRGILQEAIVEKGLKPAMEVYANRRGWHTVTHNWNQVCNAGIGLGALAVADIEPQLSGRVLKNALKSIPRAMKAYAPDGAGHEGPSYWSFGSFNNILFIDSLESALGTDFALSEVYGFRFSGDYQLYLSGVNRVAFDFGDCGRSKVSSPQHFWMGKKYGVSRYSSFRHSALAEGQGGNMWDLLWFDEEANDFSKESIPRDKYFRGVEVASVRDSWTDDNGFIAAMQGGKNNQSHRHLDLGSFILESYGVRWIIDSGKESETYHRHKNNTPRNDYYRVRAEGHNTLVINPDDGPDQNPKGNVAFTDFVSKESRVKATLDLTDAYREDAKKITRTFELERGDTFTVTDRIECKKPSEIWSFFHSQAQVELSDDKRTAVMRQKGKMLHVRLDLPIDAGFTLLPADPLPTSPAPYLQTPNRDRLKLAVHLKNVKETVIAVRFERGL